MTSPANDVAAAQLRQALSDPANRCADPIRYAAVALLESLAPLPLAEEERSLPPLDVDAIKLRLKESRRVAPVEWSAGFIMQSIEKDIPALLAEIDQGRAASLALAGDQVHKLYLQFVTELSPRERYGDLPDTAWNPFDKGYTQAINDVLRMLAAPARGRY